jgi:hypothetical protein
MGSGAVAVLKLVGDQAPASALSDLGRGGDDIAV